MNKVKPEDFIEMVFEKLRYTEQIEPCRVMGIKFPEYKLVSPLKCLLEKDEYKKDALNKLGRLEDILEEFNITTFKELRERLLSYEMLHLS